MSHGWSAVAEVLVMWCKGGGSSGESWADAVGSWQAGLLQFCVGSGRRQWQLQVEPGICRQLVQPSSGSDGARRPTCWPTGLCRSAGRNTRGAQWVHSTLDLLDGFELLSDIGHIPDVYTLKRHLKAHFLPCLLNVLCEHSKYVSGRWSILIGAN